MIDIRGRIARLQYWREYNRGLINFERRMYSRFYAVLGFQYKAVAENIKDGQLQEINLTIDSYSQKIYNIYIEEFQRIGSIYNERVQERISEKLIDTVFWTFFYRWIRIYSARKIVQINTTTKNIISNIIKYGEEQGLGNVQIANYILDNVPQFTGYRAARIARTETHTGINTAIHESVKVTGRVEEKEWLAAMDSRTRQEHMNADGERVLMDEKYIMTGEPLDYPGDPNGSPGNIISCRCAELFHTREAA